MLLVLLMSKAAILLFGKEPIKGTAFKTTRLKSILVDVSAIDCILWQTAPKSVV
jgi:hypothetical protein